MRRAFLFLAAGLLASAAVSAPAQAGMVLYTVESEIVVTAGSATSATLVFSEAVSAPLTITSTTLPTTPPISVTLNSPLPGEITFGFADAGPGPGGIPKVYVLDFTVMAPSSPALLGTGGTISGSTGTQGGVVILSVTQSTVPEPASLALLGIGMTGFLAFRRFFKKTAVA
jgi:hypothetical protein